MKKSAIIVVAALAGTIESVPLPRDIESDWLNLEVIIKWRIPSNERVGKMNELENERVGRCSDLIMF